MGFLSFEVNNQRELYLIQEKFDGVVRLKTYDGDEVENVVDIDPGDFVMLLNHYHNCKKTDHPIVLDSYEPEPEEDWFGKVRWCNDDIVAALQDKHIEPTEENVSRVRTQLGHHAFTDTQIEHGWEFIYYTIDNLRLDDEEEEVALPKADDLPDVFDFYSHNNSITRGRKYHAIRKPEQGYFFVTLEDSDCTWDIHVSEFTENFENHNWEMIK